MFVIPSLPVNAAGLLSTELKLLPLSTSALMPGFSIPADSSCDAFRAKLPAPTLLNTEDAWPARFFAVAKAEVTSDVAMLAMGPTAGMLLAKSAMLISPARGVLPAAVATELARPFTVAVAEASAPDANAPTCPTAPVMPAPKAPTRPLKAWPTCEVAADSPCAAWVAALITAPGLMPAKAPTSNCFSKICRACS